MQDLLELPNNPSLFSLSCKVANGVHEPIINNIEARSVQFSCENQFRKNVVTCSDEHREEFVNEVQGLPLNTILHSAVRQIPYYIPVFDKKLDIIPNLGDDFPFVGLSLKDSLTGGIIHKAGCIHEVKNIKTKTFLLNSPCFKGKNVVLFSSGPDTLIESIWYKRNDIDYFNYVAKMGFYAATGFNFSLFVGECPFAHQLNMKRSLFSSHLYEQSGILAIPHIYALTYFQVRRWCDWLRLNPMVHYFNVNCQLQTSRREISRVVQSIKHIFKSVPGVHAILQGFPINHVQDFGSDIARIHFADSLPHKKARNYQRLVFDQNRSKIFYIKDDSVSKAELINNNFTQKLTYLNYVKEKTLDNNDLGKSA